MGSLISRPCSKLFSFPKPIMKVVECFSTTLLTKMVKFYACYVDCECFKLVVKCEFSEFNLFGKLLYFQADYNRGFDTQPFNVQSS